MVEKHVFKKKCFIKLWKNIAYNIIQINLEYMDTNLTFNQRVYKSTSGNIYPHKTTAPNYPPSSITSFKLTDNFKTR